MDRSHNSRALMIITGMIFSMAGFDLAILSGLKSEKKNKLPINKRTAMIDKTRNEK